MGTEAPPTSWSPLKNGKIRRIKARHRQSGAFKCARFAASIGSRPELLHIRTRRRSPGQNGVRERVFGSLKYEHLYRIEIADGKTLALQAEHYRHAFNTIRPHEVLGMHRPAEIHPKINRHNLQSKKTEPKNVTMAELGRLTNLSPQTINCWEKDHQEPTPECLDRLVEALRLPVEFFMQPKVNSIPAEAVSFRALSKTPAFRRDAVLAAGEIAREIATWITERYRLPGADVPSLNLPPDASLHDVETIALRVRSQWDPCSVPDERQ